MSLTFRAPRYKTPSKPVIYLPAIDRRVTIVQYVQAIKRARDNPTQEFKQGLTCWWPCTGAEIMRQFLAGVHDRINQAVPYAQRIQEHTP